PAVVLGPFHQESLQLGQLLVAEPGGGALVRLSVQPGLSTCQPTPAVDGGRMHAEYARHGGGGFPRLHQSHGSAPPPFQFYCCSDWSCHTSLYGCPASRTSYGHAGLSRSPEGAFLPRLSVP